MEKKFLINFGALNISSFINKLIGFAFIVTFMHLSNTGDFGVYSLVWAHIGILAVWQDLGTTSVGMLQTEKHTGNLQSLLLLRLILAAAVSIVTVLLAFFFRYPLVISGCIIAFSAIIMSNAVSGFFLVVASVKQQLTVASLLSVVFNILTALVTIVIFFLTRNIYYLLVATAGMFMMYGLLLLAIIHIHYMKLTFKLDIPVIRALIKRSLVFSLIAFFATLPSRSDFVLLERLGGKESLALYAAAMKFFEAAMIVIPNYNMASLPILKRKFQENIAGFHEKIRSDMIFVIVISLGIVAATLTLGDPLITTFFSVKYINAIPILHIIIWALPLLMLTSVFLNTLYAMNRERIVVFFFVFQSLLHIVVNVALIPRYGYYIPAYLMVLGEFSQTILTGLYVVYSLKNVSHRN